MNERWFAVHTIPRHEALADAKLKRLGYKTFFPHTMAVHERSKHRTRFLKVAYLTRYTFVGFQPERAHLESAYQINSLTNRDGEYLCRMVYAGVDSNGDRMPFPIPTRIMDRLRVMCDPLDGQLFDTDAPKVGWGLEVGQRVRLGDDMGAMRGLAACIEDISADGESLKVRFDRPILGQDLVDMRSKDIEEVETIPLRKR